METSGPTSGIPPMTAGSARAVVTQWQVGQLLQATVTENNIGKVLLAIGNRQITAETSLPLQKGQQLALEVRSLGTQPVLRILSPVNEALNAAATRLLLPKQGPLTPLLATMSQLAKISNPPIPPLVNQLLRDMVKQLPDTTAVSDPAGLKKAVENSGVFLESRLLHQSGQGRAGLTLNEDFKANLLRLVNLVRNWPGSSQTLPAPLPPGGGPAPGSGLMPGTGTPGATAPQGTTLPQGANPAPGHAATPAQIGRTILAAGPSTASSAAASTATAAGATLPGTSASGLVGHLSTKLAADLLPPPLPGSVPVPQAAASASLDLLNRLGNFRTDLLQQIEAALARTQLQQLANLPREGERALLEWLLDLPVRHGDSIDLWSMRIFREPHDSRRTIRKQSASWTVQLAIDLPGLGPMQIQVRLADDQISTRFWTTHEETLPLIRGHLHELRQALMDAGLEVGELDCQGGATPAGKPHRGQPLISEKA